MKQDTRRGMPEKIRGAYAPVPFWFTGLFMVFPKTSAAGYLPVGLYMDFLRSSQRPHPVTKAPRKPDGLHGDHLWHSQRPPSFFCPCMGFLWALRRPFSDVRESCKLCGLYKDRFQAHTKTTCRKEKKLLPGQSLKTDRVTAP